MNDKVMNRGDFFKYIFKQTTSVAANFADGVFEPFRDAGEAARKLLSFPLLPVDEYANEPKLVANSAMPVYLVGELRKNLTAFSALCVNDGFLLTYLSQESCLYCGSCGSKHFLEFGEKEVTTNLLVFPLSVKEENIYILK